jgi:hypothetical protein
MPVNVNKSDIIVDLILRSMRASQSNEGDKFTSITHGFKSLSIKTSKPNSSRKKNRNY